MEPPSVEALAAIAANQGADVSQERLEGVAAFLETLWPRLQELRSVELPFLEDFVEPAHAESWVARKGRSQ